MITETQKEKIRREYIPVIGLWPASAMMCTNKITLTRLAAYAASLESSRRIFSSRELKKPFVEALWNCYGRGYQKTWAEHFVDCLKGL